MPIPGYEALRLGPENYKGQPWSILTGRVVKGFDENRDEFKLYFTDGSYLYMTHYRDCCESVYIEDIVGDLHDLIGETIVSIEELTNINNVPPTPEEADDSFTWTFYRIRTNKTTITIRWFGTSNGYYSEDVDCYLYVPS